MIVLRNRPDVEAPHVRLEVVRGNRLEIALKRCCEPPKDESDILEVKRAHSLGGLRFRETCEGIRCGDVRQIGVDVLPIKTCRLNDGVVPKDLERYRKLSRGNVETHASWLQCIDSGHKKLAILAGELVALDVAFRQIRNLRVRLALGFLELREVLPGASRRPNVGETIELLPAVLRAVDFDAGVSLGDEERERVCFLFFHLVSFRCIYRYTSCKRHAMRTCGSFTLATPRTENPRVAGSIPAPATTVK